MGISPTSVSRAKRIRIWRIRRLRRCGNGRYTETLLNCQPVEVTMTITTNYRERMPPPPPLGAYDRSKYISVRRVRCLHIAHAAVRAICLPATKNRALVCTSDRPVAVGLHHTRARMSGYPSASAVNPDRSRNSASRKSRAEATLTLSNGSSVHGCFFCPGNSRTHAGPEGVKDVLNGEPGFFPFEGPARRAPRTILYNRDHLVMVELGDQDEARTRSRLRRGNGSYYHCCCPTGHGSAAPCACFVRTAAIA